MSLENTTVANLFRPTHRRRVSTRPRPNVQRHWKTIVCHGRIDDHRLLWTAYVHGENYPTKRAAHLDQGRAATAVRERYGLAWEPMVHGVNYLTVECDPGDCPLDLARKSGMIK